MINLKTGVPGSGKTLSAVDDLRKLLEQWGKKPQDGRPIFVHGIPDLALPHAVIPYSEQASGKGKVFVPDWSAIPDGALLLIDEAQDFFPPRSSQSTAPEHVAWLNTHRHRGIDIVLITQHPKLIDGSARALVGKHQHYRRLFGGQRSIVYEWDACSDNLGTTSAVTGHFGFPKAVFACYKSAEVHTKQRFKLPKWLVIPFIGIAIAAVALPHAYSTLSNGIAGRGLSAGTKTTATAGAGAGALAPAPTPANAPASASPQSPVAVPTEESVKPKVAGCIATAAKCTCLDTVGVIAVVSDPECRVAAVELGGLVAFDSVARPASATRPPAATVQHESASVNGFNAGDFRFREPRSPSSEYR